MADAGIKVNVIGEEDHGSQNVKELIRDLERFFKEADKDEGGGLDEEEFSNAMRLLYPNYSEEELTALHMQIDANCDGTIQFNELLDFTLGKIVTKNKLNYSNRLFPLPMKVVEGGHYNKIVKIVARSIDEPVEDANLTGRQKYVPKEFLSATSDGILKFWSDRFDTHATKSVYIKPVTLPFAHKHKVRVNDMVYIKERGEIAIATNERELRFYLWAPDLFSVKYAVVTEGATITALHYWSDGKKAIFAIGDLKGILYTFVRSDVNIDGLFNPAAFELTKKNCGLENCVYVSSLLRTATKEFMVFQVPIFETGITSIKYYPTLEEFIICSLSGSKLALVTVPGVKMDKMVRKIYSNPSPKKIFSCAEYCVETKELVTGGNDGVLRVWFSNKMESKFQLLAHAKPIRRILDSPQEKMVLSAHEDQTVYVWSLEGRTCVQIITPQNMGGSVISAVYYDLMNNELILANTTIGILLGKGTDVFKEIVSSHNKPLCSAIYHSIFKQVISVCQKGDVTVWDLNTGKTIMQFNVSPFKLIASTVMALNGTQRKLVTVCNDGRVRFWNFNNGQELEVLPVTVPMEISGIICTNEMVYLTSKESNFIYCLDYKGRNPVCVEHPLIQNGVTSIAMHPNDGWMVTAAGDGVVVVWDVETLETLYYINTRKSPRIRQTAQKDNMGKINPLPVKENVFFLERYERIPVPKSLLEAKTDTIEQKRVFKSPLVHCLKSRSVETNLATVLIADEGFVSAWAGTGKGGLLAKFKATEDKDAVITCIDTDPNDQILMIGDSNGSLHVWNIEQFGKRAFDAEGPYEEIDNWKINIRPPPLLNRWKAHKGAITSVTCTPSCENFITTGFDCNVNLWTNDQHLIRTFGKDQWEDEKFDPDWEETKVKVKEREEEQEVKPKQVQRRAVSTFWQAEEWEEKPSKLAGFQRDIEELHVFIEDLKQTRKDAEPHRPTEEVEVELENPQLSEHELVHNVSCSCSEPIGVEQPSEFDKKHPRRQPTPEPIVTRRKIRSRENQNKTGIGYHSTIAVNVAARLKNARNKVENTAKEAKEIEVSKQTSKGGVMDDDDSPDLRYPLKTQKRYRVRLEKWQKLQDSEDVNYHKPGHNAEQVTENPPNATNRTKISPFNVAKPSQISHERAKDANVSLAKLKNSLRQNLKGDMVERDIRALPPTKPKN